MKLLTEYLSTKVKAYIGFPKVPKLKDILNFLDEHEFIGHKYQEEKEHGINNVLYDENKEHNAYLWAKNHSNDEYWIRFCAKNETKYIFFVRATENGKIISKDIGYIEFFDRNTNEEIKFTDYDNFINEINDYFDW